ncbi:RNA polymerase sigma-70 factor [Reichenbachiella sp. MALMAid0571]|uniref:RNA polymerase sigma factor n=1 Tax=Reichenbachiella sp. MALMAid0571 TaxID=3143939 RepID=UPI0032DF3096
MAYHCGINECVLVVEKKEIRKLLDKIARFDDHQAFKELFDRYHSWLFTVAYTIIQSNEDAEEIIEDVFVKIWEIRDRYDEINNFETYLYTVTKNRCYDKHRGRTKLHQVEINDDLAELDFMESPEDTYLYQELNSKIIESVGKLPPKCKEVYLLIRETGSSYKDAAQQLSVSPKTIESQMRIAIKKIAYDIDLYLKGKENEDRNKFLSFSIYLFTY